MLHHKPTAAAVPRGVEARIGFAEAPPHEPVAIATPHVGFGVRHARRTDHEVTGAKDAAFVPVAEPTNPLEEEAKLGMAVRVVLPIEHRGKSHASPPLAGTMLAP